MALIGIILHLGVSTFNQKNHFSGFVSVILMQYIQDEKCS